VVKVAVELVLKFQAQKNSCRIIKTGKPVIWFFLFTGRPLVLVQENQTVPAILNCWFAGSEAGTAIADVLFVM
jgi:beta-glucosidase